MPKLLFYFSLLISFSVSAQELESSDAEVMQFEFRNHNVEINVSSVLEPERVDLPKYGGFYTDVSSVKVGENEMFSFGYYRENKTDVGRGGLWRMKGSEIFLVYSGCEGRFYKANGAIFFYLNRCISQHEKNGVVFELRKNKSENIFLREVYFVFGWVLDVIPVRESVIQVVSFSDSVEDFQLVELNLSGSRVVAEFGSYVELKSSPEKN